LRAWWWTHSPAPRARPRRPPNWCRASPKSSRACCAACATKAFPAPRLWLHAERCARAASLDARDAQARALPRAPGQADDLARLRLLFDDGALLEDDALLASLDGPMSRVFERLAPEPG
jgi:hypothetical protein